MAAPSLLSKEKTSPLAGGEALMTLKRPNFLRKSILEEDLHDAPACCMSKKTKISTCLRRPGYTLLWGHKTHPG